MVLFWLDIWCGDKPLNSEFPRLFRLTACKRISVTELAVNGELCLIHWERIFTKNLLDREKAMLDVLKERTHDVVLKRDVPDRLVWSTDKAGVFSVKKLCQLMVDSDVVDSEFDFGKFWKMKVGEDCSCCWCGSGVEDFDHPFVACCGGVLHAGNGSIRAVFANNVQVATLDHVKLGVVLSALKLWPACLEIDSLSKRVGKIKFSLNERSFSRMAAWLAVDGMSRSTKAAKEIEDFRSIRIPAECWWTNHIGILMLFLHCASVLIMCGPSLGSGMLSVSVLGGVCRLSYLFMLLVRMFCLLVVFSSLFNGIIFFHLGFGRKCLQLLPFHQPEPDPNPTPSALGRCPIDAFKLGVCANVLNLVYVTVGSPRCSHVVPFSKASSTSNPPAAFAPILELTS
ncbi:hypothetical protein F3Y22_tig00005929pilonHSYRG00080 [Hibiscus syriacus]|nr:hypothetical protein F3Y22_tig00005929pilonHSYRG00080 [Hibiscus syriacus]